MKKLLCFVAFCAVFTLNSCKKGCTDKNAVNFDSKAKKDNSTCKYEGTAIFWIDNYNADKLTSIEGNYSETMTLYINGSQTASVNINNIRSAFKPDCSAPTQLKITRELNNTNSGKFSYKFITDTGILLEGEGTISGYSCNVIKVIF